MKQCNECSTVLNENVNFCPNCGYNFYLSEKKEDNNNNKSEKKISFSFLQILCALTILGSFFSLYNLPNLSSYGDDSGILFFSSLIGNLGTISGAIFMLKNRKDGLSLYSLGQLIYLLSAVAFAIILSKTEFRLLLNSDYSSQVAKNYTMMWIFIPVVFTILYWLPVNRRNLV